MSAYPDSVLLKAVSVMKASRTVVEAASKMGIKQRTMYERLRQARVRGLEGKSGKAKAAVSVEKRVGLSKKEFLGQFDSATRVRDSIRKGLRELDHDRVVKDSEFRTICNASAGPVWGQVGEEEEFQANRLSCENRVWWGAASAVKWVLQNVSKARAL